MKLVMMASLKGTEIDSKSLSPVNVRPIDRKFLQTVLFCFLVFGFYIFCPTLVSLLVDSLWRPKMCYIVRRFERKELFLRIAERSKRMYVV